MIKVRFSYFDDNIPDWHNRMEHLEYYVLVLVVSGQLTYHINGKLLYASKGDLLLLPPGTKREAYNHNKQLHQKYAVIFSADHHCELPLLEQTTYVHMQTRAFPYMKNQLVAIYRQTLEKRSFFKTIIAGMLLEMLGRISRELETSPLPRRKLDHADRLEQYMIEHFREPITIERLSQVIGRSPNYTITLFKEIIGYTPIDYQHRLRIAAAKEMLENTRYTVSAIAEQLGYYDTSYFYRVFRQHTGTAPSAYAKSRYASNQRK